MTWKCLIRCIATYPNGRIRTRSNTGDTSNYLKPSLPMDGSYNYGSALWDNVNKKGVAITSVVGKKYAAS